MKYITFIIFLSFAACTSPFEKKIQTWQEQANSSGASPYVIFSGQISPGFDGFVEVLSRASSRMRFAKSEECLVTQNDITKLKEFSRMHKMPTRHRSSYFVKIPVSDIPAGPARCSPEFIGVRLSIAKKGSSQQSTILSAKPYTIALKKETQPLQNQLQPDWFHTRPIPRPIPSIVRVICSSGRSLAPKCRSTVTHARLFFTPGRAYRVDIEERKERTSSRQSLSPAQDSQ